VGHVVVSSTEHETLTWSVERLWELARDLPIGTVPVESLLPILEEVCCILPDERSCMRMARHAKRVLKADLSHPVILAEDGALFDGSHRIAKAWVLGLKEIQVVRFPVNPEPDKRELKEPSPQTR
jgi:nitrogen fixation protein